MPLEAITNACADAAFAVKRLILRPYRVRRAHLYGLGLAKSGTSSVHRMFSRSVRTAHEPQLLALIDQYLDWAGGRVSEREMSEWVRARDRKLALEVDSSWVNFMILEFLLREFPDARFMLTIRDCYSWLNSTLNHSVRYRTVSAPQRVKARDLVFNREGFVHAPEEQMLREGGFYPLDGYLSGWAAHNGQVLATVPRNGCLWSEPTRSGNALGNCGLRRFAAPDRSPAPHARIPKSRQTGNYPAT